MKALVAKATCLALWTISSIGCAQEPEAPPTAGDASTDAWSGLWVAERRFAPQLDGPLTIQPVGGAWVAAIQGERANVVRTQVDARATHWSFSMLDLGRFEGHQESPTAPIQGHWIQPAGPVYYSKLATPVRLEPTRRGMFTGTLRPAVERYLLSLPLVADGAPAGRPRYRTFLRNPDRNSGIYFPIESAEVVGDEIRFADQDGEAIGIGHVIAPGERFVLQHRGEVFDFTRGSREAAPGFYPRRAPEAVDQLLRPVDIGDGWETASLAETGMRAEPVVAMINEQVAFEPAGLREPFLHSLLVAHRGKLVIEEYFHGHHRETLHDSRSAGKTIASALLGMAIHQGALAGVDTPVYAMFGGVDAFANPDPRKAKVTVRHLITMSSGLACNDDDSRSPGNEDTQWNQTVQRDFYAFALSLPMAGDPGETAAYCSTGIHLVGGVVAKATGRPLKRFFHESLAEPLQITDYRLNLSPTGTVYMGGGLQLRPRDFLKLGQVYLDGGVWRGQRLVSKDWVEASFSPQSSLGDPDNYGFAWWRYTYEYDGRQFETYSASGNGGQILMVVPGLELVIMMNAGNYGDARSRNRLRFETMWNGILPAVIQGGS